MRFGWTRALLLPVLLAIGLPLHAAGQAGPQPSDVLDPAASHESARVVKATRLTGPVDLDGSLEEPAWARAIPVTEFIQTEPLEGEPATERTEVYVLFDDDAFYVGARLYDSTGRVHRRLGRRDSFLTDSDWFYVMLDSHHGHTSAYQFSVNPSGVKRDEVTGGGGMGDNSWDAVWDVGTSIVEDGWIVELRIPFSQLRFGPAETQTWGIQFSRRILSKEEVVVFSYTPRSERGGVSRYGHLVGLESLRAGKRFEALPYIVSGAEYLEAAADNPFRDGAEYHYGAGLDLKYRLTSAITIDATVNPDFGQVEVDPAVINLTAFETSFDEKRPFFVEGSDIFRFAGMGGGGGPGGGGGGSQLFYSRRIGRAPQASMPDGTRFSDRPDASTILGAAKLSGRTANGWNVGVVEAVTARETAAFVSDDDEYGRAVVEPLTNYFVGRAEKELGAGQSSIGGILTTVHRSLDDDGLRGLLRSTAYTGGLDFRHEFGRRMWAVTGYFAASRVAGSAAAILRTQLSSSRYYQRPDADYVELDSSRTAMGGYAARLELRRIAGLHWRGEANVSAVSPGFETNDIGFQTSVDRLGADLNLTYQENRPGRLFRNYRISSRTSRDFNFGLDAVSGRTSLSANAQLVNYWGGSLTLTRNFAAFDDRLTRGGPLARDLAGWSVNGNLHTDNRRTINGRLNTSWSWGESGARTRNISAHLSIRPAENWTVSAGPSFRRGESPAQFITTETDASALATWGKAYVFAPIDQTTVSMETRLNVNFTPELSLDVYAQPFVATGDYGDPIQLRAPRTFEFDPYPRAVGDRDFNTQSLRGNAVLRWEWQPGSTLFLVWQQRRSRRLVCDDAAPCDPGTFDLGRDAGAIFDARPDNVFLIKMNYWLNL